MSRLSSPGQEEVGGGGREGGIKHEREQYLSELLLKLV